MTYEFLSHTADVKVRCASKTLQGVFREAALALKETIAEDLIVKNTMKKNITIEGNDNESLLYNFLEEFLYLLDAEDFLFGGVEDIRINNNKLEAVILGDNASEYNFANKVKAVTYNEMIVKEENNKFIIEFVLDV